MAYTLYTNIKAKSVSYGGIRSASAIKYLVFHYTGNKTDTAIANAKYFKNTNTRAAGAHYFVDDTSVYQSIDDLRIAWSVGGSKYSDCSKTGGGTMYKIITNTNSISIEMCSTNSEISKKTMENAAILGKLLMQKYNIPITNVYRHFDVTGKKCIGWNGWWGSDSSKWNHFKSMLCTSSTSSSSTTITPQSSSVKFLHGGIDYSPVFDPTYYANKYADLKAAFGTDANKLFGHFIDFGLQEGRQAISTFNVTAYKNRYADLQKSFGNDLPAYYRHYITNGKSEGRVAI